MIEPNLAVCAVVCLHVSNYLSMQPCFFFTLWKTPSTTGVLVVYRGFSFPQNVRRHRVIFLGVFLEETILLRSLLWVYNCRFFIFVDPGEMLGTKV